MRSIEATPNRSIIITISEVNLPARTLTILNTKTDETVFFFEMDLLF